MARQFQGAAKGRGFNPIPISSANITRMREENERILQGMRERRESERRNEERQLRDMQADAAYYEKVRNRDFKIADTNLSNERKQLEYNEAERVAQYNASTEAMSQIFADVAKFSATASKLAQAKQDERDAENLKRAKQIRERNGPLDLTQIEFNKGMDAEAYAREVMGATVEQMRAAGAPEHEIQKILNLGVKGSVAYVAYDAKLRTEAEWPSFRAEYARENDIDLSKPELTAEWLPEAWAAFEEKLGWTQFSPELLGTALDAKGVSDKTFVSGITTLATENIKAENIEGITNMALANWDLEGQQAFREIQRVTGSYTQAHQWVGQIAGSMDANGNYFLTDSQWKNFSVMPDGQPYYVDPGTTVTVNGKKFTTGSHQSRGLTILNNREDKRREWQRGVATDERLSYQEESKAWLRHIVIDGNNTPGDIAAAVKSFKDNVQGMPEWLRKLTNAGKPGQGQYNSDLISTAKDYEARGMLYQGLVDKVYERDPKQGNALQKSLNEQDPFMQDDFYKQYYDSIDKLPLKQDLGGNYPEPNADAIRATGALQDAYKEMVARAVADGATIKDAGYSSMKAIESGFNDPNSPFHRVYNPNTAQYEFAKLYTKSPKEIAESLDQADSDFLKRLDSGKIQDVFSDPDMILTDAQFDANVASMSRPGYTFPARVHMLVQTGHLKGSHMEIMQQIATLKGKPAIQPPPSLQTVSNHPPKANQLLALWGPRSSNIEARAHGAGMQAQLPEAAPEASLSMIPDNLRVAYMSSAQKYGISVAENAAMGEIESAHNTANVDSRGVSVSYNGTSEGPMMINKSAHKAFYAQHNGNPSAEANIDYGTGYYARLKERYNGDSIAAAMAYNGGERHYELWLANKEPDWVKTEADRKEWDHVVNEMTNHGKKFAKAYYKYSGDASLLQNPLLLRN
jgi:hypothetical protein